MAYKRRTFALTFLLALTASQAIAQEQITLGVSTPLTGEGATFGADIRDVLLFANEKIAHGRYRFDFQDDKCDPKTGVEIAKLFSEVKRYRAVTGYACSGVSLSAAPIMEKAEIPMMVLVASSPGLRGAGHFVFRSCPSDDLSASILANWIKTRGVEKLGIISAESDYCQDLREYFVKSYPNPVLEENYLPATTDFRPTLLRLKRNGATGIFLNSQFEGTIELMLRDLAVLQWKPKLYAAYYPSSPALLDRIPKEMEGIEFVDLPSLRSSLNEEGKKLYSEYVSRYGKLRSYEWCANP
jgi:branched-chain amino acid transport system substrate-binding protein